ncbi:MAG: response regulator [Spirochaetota bacterium]|jgi:signal transduction histidine kinase/CheY-like chemotaxis protein/HPt (histidine-containing phosphotransfer) domain-containing protein|nr:response regulator [Spirochaetota bacterium]
MMTFVKRIIQAIQAVPRQYLQALIVWVAFALMVIASYWFAGGIVREQLVKEAQITISHTQTKIWSDFLESKTLMASISEALHTLLLTGSGSAVAQRYMRDVSESIIKNGKRHSREQRLYGVFDIFGGLYISAQGQELRPENDPRELSWYKDAVRANGEIVFTEPYFDEKEQGFLVTCVRRIFDERGNALGALGMDMPLDRIVAYVADTRITPGGFSMLFSKSLQNITHPEPKFVGKMIRELPGDIAGFADELAQGKNISEREVLNYKGKLSVGFVYHLENNWRLALITPYDEYYHDIYTMQIGLVILGIILAAILSVILVKILTSRDEANDRMQLMFDTMPLGATFYDKNSRAFDCNKSMIKLLGLSNKREFFDGSIDLSPKYQPDGILSGEKKAEMINKAFSEGYSRLEWTYQARDGAPVSAEVTLIRVKFKDDDMILVFTRDLRELKAVFDEIRRESEKSRAMSHWYESILNAVPLPIAAMDTDYKWTFINTAVEKYFGKTFRESLGLPCSNLGVSICNTENCGVVCAKKGIHQTFFSDNSLSYQVDVAVLKDLRGKTLGYVEVMQDITNLRQMAKKQADAESANFAKTTFLAKVSHELRTPLNAVLGIAEIQLQDEMLSADITEAFGRIRQSGAMLLGLINDILDLSKIEAGKLELLPNRYDAASLLKDTAQSNLLRIGSKPLSFNLQIDPAIPSELFGDELRIKQILNNLLSNAIKYTKEGWVKLTVEVDPLCAAENRIILVIRVQDTGSGMTEEQIQVLFEEYSRFNMVENRATEGTGLGMNITKRLVDMMGGEISVESKLNKGTMVTVRLPQERLSSKEIGANAADDLRWFRTNKKRFSREPMPYGSVLVVDDLESNIYVAKGLLTPYKLAIDVASSGAEALEKIEGGKVYDVVFMDHLMPVMDGIEAARQLRSMGYVQPIIALTANAVAGQAEMFLTNGFDGFISKPIDIRQLDAALLKYIRDRQTPEVIQAARSQTGRAAVEYGDAAQADSISSQLAETFLRDAAKVFGELEAVSQKTDPLAKEDIERSTFNFHAIKGALANVGETALFKLAAHLEESGKQNNAEAIQSGISPFLDSLRRVIEKISMIGNTEEFEEELTEVDFLHEKLKMIYNACAAYDKIVIKSAIGDLRCKKWTYAVSEMLKSISEHLLHSEFMEIADTIKNYMHI